MIFKELPWDSAFFGFPVAKCEIDEPFIDYEVFKRESLKFKLVYCFCQKEINPIPSTEFHLVDTKVTLAKEIQSLISEPIYLSKHFHINDDLKQLAFLSGKYSRFKCDKNFSDNQFERMYLKWLEKNCKNSDGNFLYSHVMDNKILGFVAFSFLDSFASIDLIAVHTSSQRKGLGIGFLRDIDMLVSRERICRIQVSTQLINEPALKLYESCGYRINDLKYIYHFWNETYHI